MHGTESFTKGSIFKLIVINCAIFLFQIIQPAIWQYDYLTVFFGLRPSGILHGEVWQIFTYMFLHGSPEHLLFNMYSLFIFGITVEEVWGSRKVLLYYLFCGLGAGVTIFLVNLIVHGAGYNGVTIGASGAIFGLLLAFGALFPEAEVLLFFIIPMKARTMVIVFGAIELYFELSGGMGNISHVGHLGGLLFGIIYFVFIERRRALKRKVRGVMEKIEKPVNGSDSSVREVVTRDENLEMKKRIIKKLEETGASSITEDEYQFVKYLDIMTESGTIRGRKLDITDDHISDRQFLEIVKKYLTL
ncbi:MAG TPA: rhomboid family intramembrane serine protease [Spirochaetota bacterium]